MDSRTFEAAVRGLTAYSPRPEIVLEEIPAPQKLATYAFAFSADVSNGFPGDAEDEIASGRFVLLHEPGGQDAWEGEYRCVTYIRAAVDFMMQEDPLLPEVGWNWLLESLNIAGCQYVATSGTVTRVASSSFGKLSLRKDEAEMEIRASWTPMLAQSEQISNHLAGWCTLLAEVAGLAPIADGVSAIKPSNRGPR